MSIVTKVIIDIEGCKPLGTKYHSVRIQQELFDHHSFEVTVPYEALEAIENSFFHEAHEKYCGKPITIQIIPIFLVLPALEFKGIITNISLSNAKGKDFNHRFVLSGYSLTYMLEDGRQRRPFVGKTLEEIFDEVLEVYPVDDRPAYSLTPQYKEALPYTVQYDESSYAFLRRLADEYGEWFYCDGEELYLGLPNEPQPPKRPLELKLRETQEFDMNIGLKPSTFDFIRYEYLPNTRYIANSTNKPLTQLERYTKFALGKSEDLFTQQARLVLNRQVSDNPQFHSAIQERKESQASSLVIFTGTSENPDFAVGKVVDVYGSRRQGDLHPYGSYRLTKVTHVVEDNNYHNTFEALPAAAKRPPPNPLVQSPQGVPELAIVEDVADPEYLGRVKVCYAWSFKKQQPTTDWIRVSTPYSGKGNGNVNGQLFTPEVGSQVLVGYEQGRPEFPVVLGNLFSRKNKQQVTEYTYPENYLKFIRTAGGNTITFDDTDEKERIIISNLNNGNSNSQLEISFAASGAISLTTQGTMLLGAAEKMTLRSKEIELLATDKIELKTDRPSPQSGAIPTISLSSTEVKITATTNVNIGATKHLEMKSGNTVRLDGTGETVITGSRVDIN